MRARPPQLFSIPLLPPVLAAPKPLQPFAATSCECEGPCSDGAAWWQAHCTNRPRALPPLAMPGLLGALTPESELLTTQAR